MGHLQLLQRDGELELVLGVGGDGEGLLLKALRLEEARDAVVLLLRHRRQDLRRRLEVTPGGGGTYNIYITYMYIAHICV